MFATFPFPSKRIPVNAALALTVLLSGTVQSQDSAIDLEQSDSRISHKPSQIVSFRADDDDDEKARDRKRSRKGKQREKSKQSRDRQESSKNQRRPNVVHPPLPNGPHHEQPSFAPVHPEVLELLGNIHRSLKSIESMMREENERDRKGPEQAMQLMNRMPPTFGPPMFGPPKWTPQKSGPQIWNPSSNTPHPPQMNNQPRHEHNQPSPPNAGLKNNGPRNDGPRNAGPRNDGS